MTVREATRDDFGTFDRLFAAYAEEFWERPWPPPDPGEKWYEGKLLFVAEENGEPIGVAGADLLQSALGHVHFVYVVPDRRRAGVGKALLRALAERFRAEGILHVTLNVDSNNAAAAAVWQRLGFVDYARRLTTPLEQLERRLVEREAAGPSFGSVHVQTDDETAVRRAVEQFVPRLGASAGTEVSAPRNGWIAVYDELCDREPKLLRRLARELSDRRGAVVLAIGVEEGEVVRFVLFERGRVADEYLSVPEYYGPLPPGDVVALRANPTVVARLTGAEPARVRAAARNASSPDELPPAAELVAAIAAALGVQGADHGYQD